VSAAALFVRTTRSVGLTEAGQRFLGRAGPAFEELVAAAEAARDVGGRPTGLLRLSVPRAVVAVDPGAGDRVVLPGLSGDRTGDRASDEMSILPPAGSMPASASASSSRPTWSRCG